MIFLATLHLFFNVSSVRIFSAFFTIPQLFTKARPLFDYFHLVTNRLLPNLGGVKFQPLLKCSAYYMTNITSLNC